MPDFGVHRDTDLTLSEQEVEACKSGSCPQDILDEINKALRSKKELQSVKVGKQGSAPSEEMVGILKDGVANIHSRVQPVRLVSAHDTPPHHTIPYTGIGRTVQITPHRVQVYLML